MTYKIKDIPEIEKSLKQAKEQLKDVQERGDDALSAYDLSFGYNAEFYLVRCPMLQHHVNYYQNILNGLTKERDYQPTLF
jgi:hypothetical protein